MSILIKNIQVVDGRGGEPYKADVFIDKNIISAIGDLKNKSADEVINGLGHYLTPGFIDIDTASDHYLSLLTNPLQSDFINQGVSTTIGGSCGSSLAPLLYGTLESIRKWVDTSKVNVGWHSVREFLETLKNFPLGVNFGTMAGHLTIRRSLVGEDIRDLSRNEMSVFKKILAKAMDEGAFGLSTGLGYAHGANTPYWEIKELAAMVKELGGVYSTHLRSEDKNLAAAVNETVKIAEETGVRTLISHFRPILGYEENYREALKIIKNAYSKMDLRFYIYPYDASLDSIYKLLPSWAQERNLETMLEKIKNPVEAKRMENDMVGFDTDCIRIAESSGHDYLVGKTLVELSEMFDLSPIQALLKVMEITKLRATVFDKNTNYPLLLESLKDDKVFIASNGDSRISSPHYLKHEKAAGTFTKYLEIVLSEKVAPIASAIKRITSYPASYFGVTERGVVQEGKIADLAVLDQDTWKVKDVIVGGRSTNGVPLTHQASRL